MMPTDYEVRSGDSLSKIAARQGMSLDRLLELNPSLRSNPNLIQIGQRLRLSEASPTSLLNMLPSEPSMESDGSSFSNALSALKEFANNANQSIYAGSQDFQSAVSDAYNSILERAKASPAVESLGETLDKLNYYTYAYPRIAGPAARYIYLGDDTISEDKIPQGARNALAFLVANHADELAERGIKNYSLYQKYGGATDMAGMNETPTNFDMDVLAKILGDMSPSGFNFNEDGSVTVDDRYNVNLSTEFMKDEFDRRMERSGGKNITGATTGGLEYRAQQARNAMASVRPDMYDYKLPSLDGVSVHPDERELTGYINRVNLSAEDIERARLGLEIEPQTNPGTLTIDGETSGTLLGYLIKQLSKPTTGGMRGF